MSEIKTRPLVIKRDPRIKSRLALCDEETGQPLGGQTSVEVESHSGEPSKVIVTFEAWGAYGIRFEDEPRQKQ